MSYIVFIYVQILRKLKSQFKLFTILKEEIVLYSIHLILILNIPIYN